MTLDNMLGCFIGGFISFWLGYRRGKKEADNADAE